MGLLSRGWCDVLDRRLKAWVRVSGACVSLCVSLCVNLFVCLGLCAGRAVHLLEGE
jgi:hypothetical protein